MSEIQILYLLLTVGVVTFYFAFGLDAMLNEFNWKTEMIDETQQTIRIKDLTDEEIASLAYKPQASNEWDWLSYARAVIAAYKEKNK